MSTFSRVNLFQIRVKFHEAKKSFSIRLCQNYFRLCQNFTKPKIQFSFVSKFHEAKNSIFVCVKISRSQKIFFQIRPCQNFMKPKNLFSNSPVSKFHEAKKSFARVHYFLREVQTNENNLLERFLFFLFSASQKPHFSNARRLSNLFKPISRGPISIGSKLLWKCVVLFVCGTDEVRQMSVLQPCTLANDSASNSISFGRSTEEHPKSCHVANCAQANA